MRVSEKLALIDKIGRELQSRFGYGEIDAFLAEFGISPPKGDLPNSKWVYSKAALSGIDISILIKIAEELEIPLLGVRGIVQSPPLCWAETSDLRLFINDISRDKDKAMRLKECLARYGINGFVAHEDIHPTLEWQVRLNGPFVLWTRLLPSTRWDFRY